MKVSCTGSTELLQCGGSVATTPGELGAVLKDAGRDTCCRTKVISHAVYISLGLFGIQNKYFLVIINFYFILLKDKAAL